MTNCLNMNWFKGDSVKIGIYSRAIYNIVMWIDCPRKGASSFEH